MANATSLSALTVADINISINHEPRILDLRLAKALEFERPRNIRKLIEQHRGALERFGGVSLHSEAKPLPGSKGGRPISGYWLNKKQALYLCTKSETERATEVTIQMVEVFDAVTSSAKSQPAIESKPALPPPERQPAWGVFEGYNFLLHHDGYKRGDKVLGLRHGQLGIFELFSPPDHNREAIIKIGSFAYAGRNAERALLDDPAMSRPGEWATIVETVIVIGIIIHAISQGDGMNER